jgi:glutamate synthase (NADPH) small chain
VDQKELRRLEKKCIQEEAPACEAACPLHVDARAFVDRIAQENWEGAWKVLRGSMPLPGILGRICDAPCMTQCKRGEVGAPIDIGRLEHACVAGTTPPALKLPPMPSRNQKVAVWGSGLSSLTVAWDLLRKGYGLTLFEPTAALGSKLLAAHPQDLTAEIIAHETEIFERLGLSIHLNSSASIESFLKEQQTNFDALYLGLDLLGTVAKTRANGMEHLFTGGATPESAASPVWQAAEGRWAATAIDRYLQKVSLTAGREKEGPYASRLYTNLENIAPLPAIQPENPDQGYTLEEALQEARRCIQCECLECVKVCAYLAHYKGYPKKYAREIYNNASIVMGTRQANKLINSCSLCGLCEQVCPEGFAMQELCLSARQGMVARDKMPPSAHEFALLDMAFSQGPAFAMARQDPALASTKTSSAHLFFPGCQLCASAPQTVFDTYAYLRAKLEGGVGLLLDCCAAPAHWSGRQVQFQESLTRLRQKWHDLGKPRVIAACATCLKLFREHLKEVPLVSIWEIMAEVGQPNPQKYQFDRTRLAIHDPCTARHDAAEQQRVRALVAAVGMTVEELPLSGAHTECCGFGGLMQNAHPELATASLEKRAALSPSTYLATCAMCRDNLAAVGKPALHLLDLLFPSVDLPDPAARPRPGWSQRQENRARLKARFKKEVWKENLPEMEAHERIQLRMTPDVEALLEQRRILVSDIQKVILHAEASGQKFTHSASGRFKAAHAPYKATFWVEYEPYGDDDSGMDANAYTIYNAYMHRMTVSAPTRMAVDLDGKGSGQ